MLCRVCPTFDLDEVGVFTVDLAKVSSVQKWSPTIAEVVDIILQIIVFIGSN